MPRLIASARTCWRRASCSRIRRPAPPGRWRHEAPPGGGSMSAAPKSQTEGKSDAKAEPHKSASAFASSVAATKGAEAVQIATPAYWDEACKHLIKKDRVMKRIIPLHGGACLETRGDAFVTLARSIVGQQISVKAAQSVW